MPQLGESVTEGTVTRWLKKEGERVVVDEPLLEVSTDKVDTEIHSPASGILRGIAVDEDETVAVGAPACRHRGQRVRRCGAPSGRFRVGRNRRNFPARGIPARGRGALRPRSRGTGPGGQRGLAGVRSPTMRRPRHPPGRPPPGFSWARPGRRRRPTLPRPAYAPPPAYGQPRPTAPYVTSSAPVYSQPAPSAPYGQPAPPTPAAPAGQVPAQGQTPRPAPAESASSGSSAPVEAQPEAEEYPPPTPLPTGADAPYMSPPLVRKLAAEHAVNLETVTGTGVGGRIRKQDVIEASRAQRAAQPQQEPVPSQTAQPQPPQVPQQAQPPQVAPAPQEVRALAGAAAGPRRGPASGSGPAPGRGAVLAARHDPADVPASPGHRPADGGVAERLGPGSTTVVEADVTAIARLHATSPSRTSEARRGSS